MVIMVDSLFKIDDSINIKEDSIPLQSKERIIALF